MSDSSIHVLIALWALCMIVILLDSLRRKRRIKAFMENIPRKASTIPGIEEQKAAWHRESHEKLFTLLGKNLSTIDDLQARLAYARNEFLYIGSEGCCCVDLAKEAAGDGLKACDLSKEFVR